MSTIAYHRQGVKLRTYIHKNTITERYTLNCYNYNHELISNEKICIGTKLIPIIEIVGIRFTDKNFNVEIKLVQALITNVDLDENINKSMFLGSISSDTMIKQKQSKNIIDEEDNEETKLEMDGSSKNLNFETVCDKNPDAIHEEIEPIEKEQEPMEKQQEPMEKQQEPIGKEEAFIEKETDTIEKETDTIEKETNTIEKETNTIEKETDTIEKETNTIEKETDTIEKETDTIEKETDTIEKESIDDSENLQIKLNDDNKDWNYRQY